MGGPRTYDPSKRDPIIAGGTLTYTPTHIYIYICIYIHICIHIYVCTYFIFLRNLCLYIYLLYLHISLLVCLSLYIYTKRLYINKPIHICILVYIHIQIIIVLLILKTGGLATHLGEQPTWGTLRYLEVP